LAANFVLTPQINGGNPMPMLSDQRRKKIQAKQRKAKNALSRAAKIAKKERNKAA
jgi:hypothetical protein